MRTNSEEEVECKNGDVLDFDQKNEEDRKIKKLLMKKLSQSWMCCSQKYSMMTLTMTTRKAKKY
jgi:hypothetical protein